MNINELTLGQLKEIQAMTNFGTNKSATEQNKSFFVIGQKYFIRTVTFHYCGVLEGFDNNGLELIFKNVSWIADDGRFTDAMLSGTFKEVEMYKSNSEVLVNRGTIVDAVVWTHELPKEQK